MTEKEKVDVEDEEEDSGATKLKPLKKNMKDDLCPLVFEVVKSIDFKFYGLLFLMFLFITSDVFIERILSQFSQATQHQTTTPYGSVIQAIFLVITMLLVSFLINKNII